MNSLSLEIPQQAGDEKERMTNVGDQIRLDFYTRRSTDWHVNMTRSATNTNTRSKEPLIQYQIGRPHAEAVLKVTSILDAVDGSAFVVLRQVSEGVKKTKSLDSQRNLWQE